MCSRPKIMPPPCRYSAALPGPSPPDGWYQVRSSVAPSPAVMECRWVSTPAVGARLVATRSNIRWPLTRRASTSPTGGASVSPSAANSGAISASTCSSIPSVMAATVTWTYVGSITTDAAIDSSVRRFAPEVVAPLQYSFEEAWARYQDVVVEVGKTWDWSSYADVFTEDATYVEHALGNMSGREAIREWIVSTMNMFPGSEMPFYPVTWYSIDVDKGWVINKNVNTMKDPGDGSVSGRGDHGPAITRVTANGVMKRMRTTR